MEVEQFYDETYFIHQNRAPKLQGQANLFKFSPFISEKDNVLDFGSGSGALLRAIGDRNGSTLGVEINSATRTYSIGHGTKAVPSLSDVETNSIDVCISNHAIEHVTLPFDVMNEIHRVLRPGGRLVVVVPCDRVTVPYVENDKDFHLFSWSRGNLGNLAQAAGFNVEASEEIMHRWPPYWQLIISRFGISTFHIFSRMYGRL